MMNRNFSQAYYSSSESSSDDESRKEKGKEEIVEKKHEVVIAHMQRVQQQLKELEAVMDLCLYPTTTKRISAPNMTVPLEQRNPYRKILANNERMMIQNIQNMCKYCVVIVGLNTIGCLTAESVVRCGIGKLVIVDDSTVEPMDVGQMFFDEENVGYTRISQARQRLVSLNPDVEIEELGLCVSNLKDLERLKRVIEKPSHGAKSSTFPVKLVIHCLFDPPLIRNSVQNICLAANVPFMVSDILSDGLSGYIRKVVKGSSSCLECPLKHHPEWHLLRKKRCKVVSMTNNNLAANALCLPATLILLAGLVSHSAMKIILQFGQVPSLVIYDGAVQSLETVAQLPPDPLCKSPYCCSSEE